MPDFNIPKALTWREQMALVADEINKAGGVSSTLSRQEVRKLMRMAAKNQATIAREVSRVEAKQERKARRAGLRNGR